LQPDCWHFFLFIVNKPRVLGGLFPAAWNKFYKRDLIKTHNIHFARTTAAEDNVFVYGATLNSKNIGYTDRSLYNYLIHDKSALHTRSDKNLCVFKAMDAVKRLIWELGLTSELSKEYDRYLLRTASFFSRKIESYTKFKEVCGKKLPPHINKILNERVLANSKLFAIIQALITRKCKF